MGRDAREDVRLHHKDKTSDISDVQNSPKNSGLPAGLRSSVSLVVLNTNSFTNYVTFHHAAHT